MCCNYKILKETENGILIFMNSCKKYQLSFNNLHFCFEKSELEAFKEYLGKVDISYWEKEYENSIYTRRIPIPTLQKNFVILIDRFELIELQNLMNFETKRMGFLDFKEIKYNSSLN